MLTDDDLRQLVEGAASAAPEPSGLDMSTFAVDVVPRRRRSMRVPAALGAAAAVLVAVLFGGRVFSEHTDAKKAATAPVATGIGGSASTTVPAREPHALDTASSAAAGAGGVGGGATAPPAPSTAQVPPVADSAKVIKNGTLEVRVNKGTVTESMNKLTALATGFGGYVSESRTTASSESGAQASATVSVRVPAAAFEQLISEASKLGEVRSTSTSGQDVTAQFTDIDAQLHALNATREQFLLVLGEAKNVGDILAVQDRITQVQTQIDQLEGQKRLLTDQTSFGTLSVTLLEPGATVAIPAINDDTDLGDAWQDARDHFVDGVESIVSASGTLALVAICGGALLLVGWLVYRRARLRML